MKALPFSLLAHIFSLHWVSTFNTQTYEKSGCFTPNKEHIVNISTDKQYLNSHHRVQTVSSIMFFKDLRSREHGGVTQLEMWRYLAIWAGSHWSWDNTNSVSGIALMQVFPTSHKCSCSTSKIKLSESSESSVSSISSSPWHNQHRTSLRACLRACHCSPSGFCPQVTNWWQAVCDTGQHLCHTNDVFAGGTAKGHFLLSP